ncbi:hypothetical protein SCE1572_00320 [Sorangium cellulosum So0157-2]|uniref:Uncharacterized protein n=1 Tax=Sorangium cellulosum So0157-2 TaxID=1254432 RepID=S4XKK0_SORCE|nr:hypothetical protein SCE1572_00320 [Sorangium cellulosum So0157-2]
MGGTLAATGAMLGLTWTAAWTPVLVPCACVAGV